MKIAIDASRAINEKAGIGRWTKELVGNLLKIDQGNDYLLFFSYFRKDPQKERLIKKFAGPRVKIKILKIPGPVKEKIWGWKIPWYKRIIGKADVFLAPSFFEVNLGLDIPQVVIIYDLTTFLFPEHRGEEVSERLNKRIRLACKKAKKIIAISESTKKDLINVLKIQPEKIKVIYPGKTSFSRPAPSLPDNLKSRSFILSVGTIEPRKNLVGLFKAYALLPGRLQAKYPLVIVGAQGWQTSEIFQTLELLKLEKKVKFLGYVSDRVLAKLYQEAAVFVYPSLYEGFGLPVLEAMQFGVPVVTSNISSMPEAAGKTALFVDSQNPKSICSGLQRLLEHKEERENLARAGKNRAAKFSWEKAASKTLKVFEEVIGDRG